MEVYKQASKSLAGEWQNSWIIGWWMWFMVAWMLNHMSRVGSCVNLPGPMCVWYEQFAYLTSMRPH